MISKRAASSGRTGLKTVRRRLADGSVRVYEYAASRYDAAAPRAAQDPPGIAALSVEWRQSPEWKRLADQTRRTYLRALNVLEDEIGYLRLSELETKQATRELYRLRDSLAARPAWADIVMATASSMFTWAVRRTLLDVNRARDMPRLRIENTRADIVLEPHEEAAIRAVASADLCRAVDAALATGLRVGDLCALRRGLHVGADGWASIVPQKTQRWGIRVFIPPQVLASFAAPDGDVLVPRQDGAPWTAHTLGSHWRAARAAAGVTHLHFHDLRGTVNQRLLDAGCSDPEMKAVMGKLVVSGSMKAYAKVSYPLVLAAHEKLRRLVHFPAENENRKRPA